jgi:hypothetical protein
MPGSAPRHASGRRRIVGEGQMPTHDRPPEEVTAELLEAHEVFKGQRLEYKEVLPADREKFLADVVVLANSSGGDIIFGLRERREEGRATGLAVAVVGIRDLNFDSERLRLLSIIRDGTAPRVGGVTIHHIPRTDGAPCILLRVSKSLAGPHMVQGGSRFYGRTQGGNYQLDVISCAQHFSRVKRRSAAFARFGLIVSCRFWLARPPCLSARAPRRFFTHYRLIRRPMSGRGLWDLTTGETATRYLSPMAGEASTWRHNVDGFVVHTLRDHDITVNSYTQMYRDGGIEAVAGAGVVRRGEQGRGYDAVNLEGRLSPR